MRYNSLAVLGYIRPVPEGTGGERRKRVNDEVLFTPQWATVIAALHRETATMLRESFGVSYLSFCMLASVRSHGGRALLSELPHGALARANTVAAAARAAVRRGYLSRSDGQRDARLAEVRETPAGSRAIDEGFEAVHGRLARSVWRAYTEEDLVATMGVLRAFLPRLGIDALEVNGLCHPVVPPAHLLAVASLLRTWESCMLSFASLSFTEYRCLALLEHQRDPLSCVEIAQGLVLDRSTVSPLVSDLARKRFVEEAKTGSRRCRYVSLTKRGEVATALATSRLGDVTATLFSDVPMPVKAKANELHMRMYASFVC